MSPLHYGIDIGTQPLPDPWRTPPMGLLPRRTPPLGRLPRRTPPLGQPPPVGAGGSPFSLMTASGDLGQGQRDTRGIGPPTGSRPMQAATEPPDRPPETRGLRLGDTLQSRLGRMGEYPRWDAGRMMRMITNLAGQDRFEGFFSDLNMRQEGNDSIFGMPQVRSLYESGLLQDEDLQAFLQSILSGGPAGFDRKRVTDGGGNGQDRGGQDRGGSSLADPFDRFNRREIDIFGGMGGDIRDRLIGLLSSEGYPEDIMLALENRVRANLKGREKEELTRRSDSFASRGFTGSGIQAQDLERVERGTRNAMAEQFANIGLQSAESARGDRAMGLQGLLGLGGLNLQGEQISSNEWLSLIRSAIGRELGLGDLDIRGGNLELQRQIQEFLMNLGLLEDFFGRDEPA